MALLCTSSRARARRRWLRALVLVVVLSLMLVATTRASPAAAHSQHALFAQPVRRDPLRLLPRPAQDSGGWLFSGQLFAGEAGSYEMPLGGVTVQALGTFETSFWDGDQRIYPDWEPFAQTVTDEEGWYGLELPYDLGAAYRSLLLRPIPPGDYSFAGATSPTGWYFPEDQGIVFTTSAPDVDLNTWLSVIVPAGMPLSEDDFWLLPAGDLQPARQDELWWFTGHVFEEERDGGYSPRAGITVQLSGSFESVFWGDDEALNAPWEFLVQVATDEDGWYGLDIPAELGYEYDALRLALVLPGGAAYSGATSPVGWAVPDVPAIIFTSESDYYEPVWRAALLESGGELDENNFWLSPAGGIDLAFGEVAFQGFDGPDLVVAVEVINVGSVASPPTWAIAGNPELDWWGYAADLPALAPGDWVTVPLVLPVLDNLRDRTVDVFVYVDPEDELPELDEENNVSWEPDIFIPPPELPDLVVEFERSEVVDDGQTVLLVLWVSNQGQARAGEHLLAAWAPTGEGGGSPVPPLAAGEGRTVEVWIGLPDSARGTTLSFTAEVDADGQVGETNEENNVVRTPPVEIPAPPPDEPPPERELPDLVVAHRRSAFADEDRTLVLSLRVTNQGQALARRHRLAVTAPGWEHASRLVGALPSGEGATVEIRMPIPAAARGTAVAFLVEVDTGGAVEETNERNNSVRTSRLQIPRLEERRDDDERPDEDERPDLVVSFEGGSSDDKWHTLVLELQVANRGGATAPAHHLAVTAPGWEGARGTVSALDPGRARTIKVSMAVPETAYGEQTRFSILIDSDDEVAEANERNNRARVTLAIPRVQAQRSRELPPWVVPVAAGVAALVAVAGAVRFLRRGSEGPPAEETGEPVPLPLPPLRLLRLWVTEGPSGEGPRVAEDRPLTPGSAYTMHLQVRPRIEAGRSPENAAGAETELDVVFFTPAADVGMERTATLRLPERGPSNEIRHPFVPVRPGRHQIRAAIYYHNTLLQSAVLDAAVAPAGAARQPGAVRRLVDYVASARLDHLQHYARPVMSIFVNATAGGSHWIGVYSGDQRATPQLHSGDLHTFTPLQLDALAQRTRSLLLKIEGLKRYSHETPLSLDAPTVARRERQIVDLARNGYRLFDELFLSHERGLEQERLQAFHALLQEPATISVARCRGDSTTIPWAALYDRYVDVEKELSLCPVFKKQVTDNEWAPGDNRLLRKHDLLDNPQACRAQPSCPQRGPDGRTTVCPFGFWGMMHQIEQPLQQVTPTPVDEVPPELQDPSFDQTMYLERTARSPVQMALNAFPRLRYADRHRAQFEALSQNGDLEIVYETDRDRVLALLEKGGRHLYYFYCHGVVDDNTFKLKLGPAENPGFISSANLNPLAIKWPSQPHPLVILNGCATMALTPELIHGFMGKLRRLGAAGIVGSEVQVWEGLACPFGFLIVERLLQGRSLGEAFLDARRALQRQLNPLGLAYAYYAFAGLHVHDPENCQWCRAHRLEAV